MSAVQCAACFVRAEAPTRGWYFFEVYGRVRGKLTGAWLCPTCKRPRMGKAKGGKTR